MIFKPDFKPTNSHPGPALWFTFDKDHLLTKINSDRFSIPDGLDLKAHQISPTFKMYLGSLDGQPCFAGALEPGSSFDSHFKLNSLRSLFGIVPDTLIWIAGRANQLLHWNLTHRYCGKCGQKTEDKPDERAKKCPRCQHVNYPRLSPAVIVAILKENRILLARNRKFKAPFYSVVKFRNHKKSLMQYFEATGLAFNYRLHTIIGLMLILNGLLPNHCTFSIF